MNAQEHKNLVKELYTARLSGTDFSELRILLAKRKLGEDIINKVLFDVNEMELENLKVESTKINPNVFLILAILTLLSGLFLAYFINSMAIKSTLQWLNAIPVAGALILFYNYSVYRRRYK